MADKPLFVAPIDLKENDTIWLLLDQPIMVERDGEVLWIDNGDIPEWLTQEIVRRQNAIATKFEDFQPPLPP